MSATFHMNLRKRKVINIEESHHTEVNIEKQKTGESSSSSDEKKRKNIDDKSISRKKALRPRCDVKIQNLTQLIEVSESSVNYSNINMRALRKIREPLMELDKLVGMKSLKESIFSQIIYYLQELHTHDDYLHTVLYGPPGCGKTTVARIIGDIFSNLGILSEENFMTANREDLIGGYLGHTAAKTSEILEASLGGVLFIDEIYSLGDKEKKDSFAKECIDTINLFLSENKEDFMLIVAGYEKEINDCFFSLNQGLRRRFMWHHHIDPYTSENLAEIFLNKVDESDWRFSDEVEKEWLTNFFRINEKKFTYTGGDIENFFTLCKIQHARRIFGEESDKIKIINYEDINNSIRLFKKKSEHDRDRDSIPFGMYN